MFGCVLIYATAVATIIAVYKESLEREAAKNIKFYFHVLQRKKQQNSNNSAECSTDRNHNEIENKCHNFVNRIMLTEKEETLDKAKIVLFSLIETNVISYNKDIKPLLKVCL